LTSTKLNLIEYYSILIKKFKDNQKIMDSPEWKDVQKQLNSSKHKKLIYLQRFQ